MKSKQQGLVEPDTEPPEARRPSSERKKELRPSHELPHPFRTVLRLEEPTPEAESTAPEALRRWHVPAPRRVDAAVP